MINFIKVIVAKALANDLTGNIISFLLNNKLPFYGASIDVSSKQISGRNKASIFWRFYESAEICFVKKYIDPDDDIIEVGSSIGVVASVISSIQKNGKLICVEANTKLLPVIRQNLAINRKGPYELINKAIAYNTNSVYFNTGSDNLVGQISKSEQGNNIQATTLNDIIELFNINSYSLICDIEGAEVGIIKLDMEALNKCNKMIIELHDSTYENELYLVSDLVELMIKNDFKILDSHGPVFVFQNNNLTI
ncbi:MAG: FkbM family methyltransferase [Pedobacter sp.]|nr:MAG: FkbM family methyltransferase [Pedobacter sp.]